MILRNYCIVILILLSSAIRAQSTDSSQFSRRRVNPSTTPVTGMISLGYARSHQNEIGLKTGLSFRSGSCGCVGCAWAGITPTIGYTAAIKNNKISHLAEFSIEPHVFAMAIGLGSELTYIRDFTNNEQYFRPSIVISAFYLEFLYGYSFTLTDHQNNLGHRFSVRFRFSSYD